MVSEVINSIIAINKSYLYFNFLKNKRDIKLIIHPLISLSYLTINITKNEKVQKIVFAVSHYEPNAPQIKLLCIHTCASSVWPGSNITFTMYNILLCWNPDYWKVTYMCTHVTRRPQLMNYSTVNSPAI